MVKTMYAMTAALQELIQKRLLVHQTLNAFTIALQDFTRTTAMSVQLVQ
jgi:hypothetical protein